MLLNQEKNTLSKHKTEKTSQVEIDSTHSPNIKNLYSLKLANIRKVIIADVNEEVRRILSNLFM